METTNTPGFVPANADPMKNRCDAPAGCAPKKKAEHNADNKSGNAAKVAVGAVAGAGIAFGAQAVVPDIPTDLDADVIIDNAAEAAENLNAAPASTYHAPATPVDEILIPEENENQEEEEFNVEDIRLELDDNGLVVNVDGNDDLPEIFEVEADDILYAHDDDHYIMPDGLDENGQPLGNPGCMDVIDDPDIAGDFDIDLASDGTDDIIDII